MKQNNKIRLAIFMCIMLVLPTIVSVLPMTSQEVSASEEVYLSWFYDVSRHEGKPIQIEKGAKFYVGDYAYIGDGDTYGTVTLFSKAKYSSNKKSVISVSSKGLLTAKKTGTATIKIKYKGKTISQRFKVVGKGTLTKSAAAKALQKAATNIKKSMPSKITKSNAMKYTKMKKNYITAAGKHSFDITQLGFITEDVKSGNYSYKASSVKLAVPDAGRYSTMDYMLYRYAEKNSPTSTRSSKAMKISSISASTKQINVKLKKAVSLDHILAANIDNYYLNKESLNRKTAFINVYILDKTTSTVLDGTGTITKGSKTVTVKVTTSSWVDGNYVTTPVKLKKGHVYEIGAKDLRWGNGKTFKVK